MTERIKKIECAECDGRGQIETGCGGGCDSPGYCFTSRCDYCNGHGQLSQLMTDEEIAIEDAARSEERHDHWVHDAFDRENDR